MRKSICLIGILEGGIRKNGKETIFKEIMAEKFSELLKDAKPQNPNKTRIGMSNH